MSRAVPLTVVTHRRADRRIAEFRTSAASPERCGTPYLFPGKISLAEHPIDSEHASLDPALSP